MSNVARQPVNAKEFEIVDDGPARRFQLPDLMKHGGWVMQRLLKIYPHRTEKDLAQWLRSILYMNDYLFLYKENGVALATVAYANPLLPRGHVLELFVLAKEGHAEEAVAFYDEFATWAKLRGLDAMVVGEVSDVPIDKIKEKFGRVFPKQTHFVRFT